MSGSVIGVLLVIVLVPHDYGIYSYVAGLCTLGYSIIAAGLNGLGVKAFVEDPDDAGHTLSTIICARLGFSLITYVLLAALALTANSSQATGVAWIALLSLPLRAFDAPDMWFLSRLESRITARIRLSVTAVMFLVRLSAFIYCRNIWFFIGCIFAEALIGNGLVLRRYLTLPDSPGLHRPQLDRIRQALRLSTPLILSTISNQVNLKIDVVLVQTYLGSIAVGVYAAAARVSELTYFVPVLLMNSTLPLLLKERKKAGPAGSGYRAMLQRSYDTAFWGGVAIAASISVAAPPLMRLLYSSTYNKSEQILLVHVWACPFVFMGAVYSKWIIAEGYLWSSLVRHTLGAVLNVCLNIYLIPRVGVMGAAWATLCSYTAANYAACFVGKKSRGEGVAMTVAMLWPLRFLRARVLALGSEPRAEP